MDFTAIKSAIAAVCTDAKLSTELAAVVDRHERRAARAAKKTAASDSVAAFSSTLLAAVTELSIALNTPVRLADVGTKLDLSNRVPAERALLAKTFNFLQKAGQLRQVGFRGGEVLSVSEVNNFQRRWIPTGWEPVKAAAAPAEEPAPEDVEASENGDAEGDDATE